MDINELVVTRLHGLMNEYNLTLNGLAYKCGVNQSTLNNFVSRTNKSVTITTLELVCKNGFDMTLCEFFDDDLFIS